MLVNDDDESAREFIRKRYKDVPISIIVSTSWLKKEHRDLLGSPIVILSEDKADHYLCNCQDGGIFEDDVYVCERCHGHMD